MAHTLIVIGDMGCKRCYLDMDRDEAYRRFLKDEGCSYEGYLDTIKVFEFDDEFCAYDAYEK